MLEFFSKLFDTDGFTERWYCGAWSDAHGYTHIASDLAIFAAYAAIPCVLAYFIVRRRGIPFPPIVWLFVAFIFVCGIGHLIEATMFWHPWYRLSALVKVLTAIASWLTVIALVRVVPQALHLPGLAKLNTELQREVQQRQQAESSLRQRALELEELNAELEFVSRGVMGRESRILELKREVNELLDRIGDQPRYRSVLEKQL